ncbi:MAG: ATP-binding protein [Bacteroidales bacterium]|jgi:signal transduction histidine kinase|nr:ATP-binding protein [Bacteroidales bacterium]
MPMQVSALNTIVVVRYVDKNYPEISMKDIINDVNKNNTYFVENLTSGKIERISIKHVSSSHYWFSNIFIIDFYEAVQKLLPDPELFYKIGKTFFNSHHFFKASIGMPLIGPYKSLKRLSKENNKYNRTKDYKILKDSPGHVILQIIHKENIIISNSTMMWNIGVFESYTRLTGATEVKLSGKCIEKGPKKHGDGGRGIWEFDFKFKDQTLLGRLFNSFLYKIPVVRTIIDNATKIQEEHNEQILSREKIIKERTDELKKIQNRLFEEERKNIEEQLKNISNELIVTEERERNILAENLHDTANQSLAISLLKIKTVLESKRYNDNPFEELIDIKEFVEQAISDMRSVTFQICPPILYNLGLGAALKWLIEDINLQNDMKITFINKINTPANLAETIEIFMYRSVRELVINIIKHAQTKHAEVILIIDQKKLIVSVQDNGAGFDINNIENNDSLSFGLFSISERFKAIGGNIEIYSKPQEGTRILLIAPL